MYQKTINIAHEKEIFTNILIEVGYKNIKIISNLDMFFFGAYSCRPIEPFGNNSVSGRMAGVIGRYLVLENNERYYSLWLSDIFGYMVDIGLDITLIDKKPQQASLF